MTGLFSKFSVRGSNAFMEAMNGLVNCPSVEYLLIKTNLWHLRKIEQRVYLYIWTYKKIKKH